MALCDDAGEAGSAVASHMMVTVLVVFVVAALIQLTGALYVRGILVDAAAAGARQQALAYAPPGAAQERVRELLAKAAPGVSVSRLVVTRTPAGPSLPGRSLVVVDVDATLPILGPIGIPGGLHARGHALAEERTWRGRGG